MANAGDKIEFFKNKEGCVRFYLKIDKIEDYYIEVSVFEVNEWFLDNEYDELRCELYLKAYIKLDGCSHVWFSEEGYKHLCGRRYWEEHSKMMIELYNVCTPLIKSYSPEFDD